MVKHQNTAKYCIALQNCTPEEHTCSRCNLGFTRKDALLRHKKLCKKPKKTIISNDTDNTLQDQISDLLKVVTKLVEQPANVNNHTNNVVMNLPPITDEEIADHLKHLTIDFIHDGAKGYADFAGTYPFKDRVLCTDKARKKLRYKDGNGELVDDANGLKLAKRFFQAIGPRNEELINAEYQTLHQKVQKIVAEGTSYNSNLTSILTKATHLQDLLAKCKDAAKGKENELTKEFVNHLSKMF